MFASQIENRVRLAALLALLVAVPGYAGGGPENVLLVVNTRDRDSVKIGEEYARLRQIPPVCVLKLEWPHSKATIKIDQFKQDLLTPILQTIQTRGLERQVDYIVYSAGFPFIVDFKSIGSADRRPQGSLTGLTYLYHRVLQAKSGDELMGRLTNTYFRPFDSSAGQLVGRSVGFRADRNWAIQAGAQRIVGKYYLSVMLGYTMGRGNNVDEVLSYLRRSALADGTHPQGTIYYMKSTDSLRSGPRDGSYTQMVSLLRERQVRAREVDGPIPRNRQDVIGTMMGVANFDWQQSGSVILPGAICEHLTSFGGVFYSSAGQTPISEFLRYGAAGSSGTVTEPTNVPWKFPHPSLHLHYVEGCSLAEAFYQAVASPYQLIILGDPLCKPWARIPEVRARIVLPTESDPHLTIVPAVSDSVPVQAIEWYLDGRLIHHAQPGEMLRIADGELSPGTHEVRVVAIAQSPIETRGRWIGEVHILADGTISRGTDDKSAHAN